MALPFIGRQHEIQVLEEAIGEPATLRIFLVSGEGGVGKTRLLQEIVSRTASLKQIANVPLKVTKLVDLANLSVFIPLNIEHEIGGELGPQHFQRFNSIRDDYSRWQTISSSPETINQQLQLGYETFVNEYNALAADNRCVVLIDTVDAHIIESKSLINFAVDVLPKLQNSVMVLAGRQSAFLFDELKEKSGSSVRLIQLEGLEEEESEAFLSDLELGPDLQEKIVFLTEGKPILLGLASTWLEHEMLLPIVGELTPSQLRTLNKDSLEKLRLEFKSALVRQILKLEEETYLYILEMAHLEKRYTAEILAFLHGISPENAEKIAQQLTAFFFVKPLPESVHLLHDEMRDMVRHLVWPQIDPLGTERKNLSLKIIDFYDAKLQELEEQINHLKSEIAYFKEIEDYNSLLPRARSIANLERQRWILSSEKFFYFLEVSPDEGGKQLARELERSTRQFLRDYSSILINVVRPYLHTLSKDASFEVLYQTARWLRSVGRFEEAQSSLERLLADYSDNSTREVEILQTLAATEGDLGLAKSALDRLEQASDIARKAGLEKSMAYIENNIGILLVSTGKIKEATEHYQKCISYAEELGLDDLRASVMNSMGYAFSILGDHSNATLYCETALEFRMLTGRERDIAISHSTLGSVYRDSSDFERAYLHYQRALDFFEANDDKYWMASIHMERGLAKLLEYEEKFYGLTQRSTATAGLLKNILQESEKDLRSSIAICRDYNRKQLPKAVHELGHVHWELGELDKAEETWRESLALSYSANNLRYALENLVGFCELDLDRGLYDRVLEHRKKLEPYYEETIESHALLWSRLAKMEGYAAFAKGDYEAALQKFAYAFPTLARHGGWGRYKLSIELQTLADRIDSLPSEVALEWCKTLRQAWSSTPETYKRNLDLFLETRELKAKRRKRPVES